MATSHKEYTIKVYKIWYEDCPEEFYIGSTKEKHLSERMSTHRKDCRKGNTSKIYNLMREKGINVGISLLKSYSNP